MTKPIIDPDWMFFNQVEKYYHVVARGYLSNVLKKYSKHNLPDHIRIEQGHWFIRRSFADQQWRRRGE